jgi:hypothetical protein
MDVLDLDTYTVRSKALDLDGIAWHDVARYPLSPAAVRTLRYMQDIESHTIVYERELAQTRVLDDPEIARSWPVRSPATTQSPKAIPAASRGACESKATPQRQITTLSFGTLRHLEYTPVR